jgi:hypothetical protein
LSCLFSQETLDRHPSFGWTSKECWTNIMMHRNAFVFSPQLEEEISYELVRVAGHIDRSCGSRHSSQ